MKESKFIQKTHNVSPERSRIIITNYSDDKLVEVTKFNPT